MKSPETASRRSKSAGKDAPIRQLASHARLLRDISKTPAPPTRSRRSRPDAIIVPAARPASALTGLIELAAALETQLVVLCSRQAKADQVAERVGRVASARALVVQVGEDYSMPMPVFETSSDAFIVASGRRTSDLSLKRNFGLLLARLRGWSKIVFVDDDITLFKSDLARLAVQLDNHQIAGMVCRDFPDNSVFCHARRLAKLRQDVFVTGAVLGVNCGDLPLPFFPNIYNEDWFFFGEAAARHRLTKAGEAHQADYDPFAEKDRASHEEFGDLLAEGLYSLIENRGPRYSFRQITHLANRQYWSRFIDARRRNLAETQSLLENFTHRANCNDDVTAAIKSLKVADDRYRNDPITPDHCLQFLEAWRCDAAEWERACTHTNNLHNTRDALSWLQATTWESVR